MNATVTAVFVVVWAAVMTFVIWRKIHDRRTEHELAGTQHDPDQVIATFQRRSRYGRKMAACWLIAAAVCGVMGYFIADRNVTAFSIAVIAAIASFATASYMFYENYRCPVCTHVSRIKGGVILFPDACRNCGALLRETRTRAATQRRARR